MRKIGVGDENIACPILKMRYQAQPIFHLRYFLRLFSHFTRPVSPKSKNSCHLNLKIVAQSISRIFQIATVSVYITLLNW